MVQSPRRVGFTWMCLFALGLTQAGCQKESTPASGTSDQQLMSSSATLLADAAHVRELAARSPGGTLVLDLSDEAQYRFLKARVAAAGKTPEQYPQFFASLESMRERHSTRKQSVSAREALANAGRDHLIGKVVVSQDGKTFEAAAFSTIQDGADYSFLDVVVWDEKGTRQLSNYGWGEIYGDGRKLWARATGPRPTDANALVYVDSASIVSVNGEEVPVFKSTTTRPTPPGCEIVHPRDNAPNPLDGIVTICLDRNYGDCDYPLVGFRQVQIPLQGTVTFPFPVTSINNTPDTYAKLVEESGGPREMAFGSFFNYLSINPSDPRQVRWSVPQHQGVFSGILFQRYEDVDLFLSIDVTMNRSGRPVQVTSKLSSDETLTTPSTFVCVPKIQIVYSCLAEGTEVKLADGKTAPIETLAEGSQVMTDSSGQALGVADTSVGIERIPMVRLVDDAGHNLLLTTSHPVLTPDRGVVWAEELKVGDKVSTESGVTTLVKAGREKFAGKVYNLKLDTAQLANSRFAKGSTMYANGFLVGDLAMQKAFEFKNSVDHSANVLAKLPSRWHSDYQSSLKNGTLTAQR